MKILKKLLILKNKYLDLIELDIFMLFLKNKITYDFTKNSLLFIDNNIHYKYENLLNDYCRLQHEYDIYDNENNLIYKYLFNKDTYYDGKNSYFIKN